MFTEQKTIFSDANYAALERKIADAYAPVIARSASVNQFPAIYNQPARRSDKIETIRYIRQQFARSGHVLSEEEMAEVDAKAKELSAKMYMTLEDAVYAMLKAHRPCPEPSPELKARIEKAVQAVISG